ncbi:MAG: hypothetical protein LBI63_00245 [Candidatus Ancillula sp.]|jgi:hypothetical protein|nr:hypothetical protein [Candidatus Ancillula sp.]
MESRDEYKYVQDYIGFNKYEPDVVYTHDIVPIDNSPITDAEAVPTVDVTPPRRNWWLLLKKWLPRLLKWLLILLFILLLLNFLLQSCSKDRYNDGAHTVGYGGDGGYYGTDSDGNPTSPIAPRPTSGSGGSKGTSSEGSSGTNGEGIQITDPYQGWKRGGETWKGISTTPEEIMQSAQFTKYAQTLFLHTNPQIVPEDKFKNAHFCGSSPSDDSITLGCYIPTAKENQELKKGGTVETSTAEDADYIFIRFFDNANLLPEVYVTASHEMLHAGWEHFPWNLKSTLSNVTKWLLDFYKRTPELKDRMRPYFDSGIKEDSNDFLNELHSIIGTEFENIGPDLENYYQIYFEDRSKVVDFHKQAMGKG